MILEENRHETAPAPAETNLSPRPSGPARDPKRVKKKSPVTPILGAVGLAGVILAAGIIPRLKHADVLQAESHEAATGATRVSVVSPIHGTSGEDLILPGNVEPIEQTAVMARTSGYVRKWYVDFGHRVKQGQLMAEIESPEVDHQLTEARAEAARAQSAIAAARASLGTAQAGVEQAKADAARFQANVQQVTADSEKAEATVQTARAEETRAKAGVNQGEAEVAKMRANLSQARAALVRAQAAVSQAKQDMETRRANLNRAKADMEIAKKTAERWSALVEQGAVSGQEADEKRSQYEARQADVQAAERVVSAAQANVEAAEAGVEANRADVEAAQAAINSSQANVAAAQAGTGARQADVNAMQSAAKSSRSGIEAARSAYNSALANIRAAQQRVDAARWEVRSAQSAYQAAQAKVQGLQTEQGFEKVVAPFDGVITGRNIATGSLVTAGQVPSGTSPLTGEAATGTINTMRSGLFGVARTNKLRILVRVPQSFVRDLKLGQKAIVTVKEFPQQEFVGGVFRITGALDPNSRTLLAGVLLPNPNNILTPGMYAQVRISPSGVQRNLRIPATTLAIDAQGTRVATVTADNTIKYVPVTLGQDFGAEVEVLKGLTGKELLVSSPSDTLTDGTRVTPVPVATEPEAGGHAPSGAPGAGQPHGGQPASAQPPASQSAPGKPATPSSSH